MEQFELECYCFKYFILNVHFVAVQDLTLFPCIKVYKQSFTWQWADRNTLFALLKILLVLFRNCREKANVAKLLFCTLYNQAMQHIFIIPVLSPDAFLCFSQLLRTYSIEAHLRHVFVNMKNGSTESRCLVVFGTWQLLHFSCSSPFVYMCSR